MVGLHSAKTLSQINKDPAAVGDLIYNCELKTHSNMLLGYKPIFVIDAFAVQPNLFSLLGESLHL